MSGQVLTVTEFICPNCKARVSPDTQGPVRCQACNWVGQAYLFTPKVLTVHAAETALPEDAPCANHPRKRATAVCAGTGNYICALCAVELDGQTYSADFLAEGGKDKAAKAFDRTLPRPDRYILSYLGFCFIPYVNALVIVCLPIWMPHAVILYFRMLRMRRENTLYARLVSKWQVVVLPILLALFAIGWVAGVVAIVVLVMGKR